MGINKIIYGDETLIDLTSDTVTAETLATGVTAHDSSGIAITGTMRGGDDVLYGTCDTAAATAAKTVTISGVTELTEGLAIYVRFTNANGVANPTLQVNSLTAKAIKRYGTTAPSTSAASSWNAGQVCCLVYDGDYWMLCDWNNTTYSTLTQAQADAGTATSARLITAKILHDTIAEYVDSLDATEVSY